MALDTPGLTAKPGFVMRSGAGFSLRSFLLLAVVLTVFYLGSFYGMERLRHRKGPWILTFGTPSNAPPYLQIEQPRLGIRSVRIVFLDEQVPSSKESETVVFDVPAKPLPFGERLHEDLTFLPGVETLFCFGHEIEILPRVLMANRKEIPWKAEMILELAPDQKAPPRVKKKKAR